MNLLDSVIIFIKKIGRLKYLILFFIFLMWMSFLDTHSWLIHNELNNEIKQLKGQKTELEKSIKQDKKSIRSLTNPDSLEVFGRKNYNLKKDNETIFYIEYKNTND